MKRFVLGLLLVSLQYGASAMQTENTAQQNAEANQEELERITVNGDDQISVLRYMVQHAEDDFYSLFNDLVDEDDFKITCEKKPADSFTRINKRICESAYQGRISNKMNFQAALGGPRDDKGGWLQRLPMQGEIYKEQRRVQKKQLEAMKKLVAESPELQQKLIKLNQAKAALQQAKQSD